MLFVSGSLLRTVPASEQVQLRDFWHQARQVGRVLHLLRYAENPAYLEMTKLLDQERSITEPRPFGNG